jgi:hypothetical protein
VSFVAISLCVASRVFVVVVVDFVIDSVRKILDTPSYVCVCPRTSGLCQGPQRSVIWGIDSEWDSNPMKRFDIQQVWVSWHVMK